MSLWLEAHSACQPEDRDGQHGPQVILGERESYRCGRWLECGSAWIEEATRCREDGERGPEREDEQQLGPLERVAGALTLGRRVGIGGERERCGGHVSTIAAWLASRQTTRHELHAARYGLHSSGANCGDWRAYDRDQAAVRH